MYAQTFMLSVNSIHALHWSIFKCFQASQILLSSVIFQSLTTVQKNEHQQQTFNNSERRKKETARKINEKETQHKTRQKVSNRIKLVIWSHNVSVLCTHLYKSWLQSIINIICSNGVQWLAIYSLHTPIQTLQTIPMHTSTLKQTLSWGRGKWTSFC